MFRSIALAGTVATLVQACGRADPPPSPPPSTTAASPSTATTVAAMPAANTGVTPPPFCGGPASQYHYTSPPLTEHATHDTLPLVPGLMVTTAIAKPEGDYESFKTIV